MRITITFFLITFCFASFGQEKLHTLNGINYNVYIRGFENRKAGQPAILFESGMGSPLSTWAPVISSIAAFAPVFAYDRAGIGKSEKSYRMPTPELVSENLQNLLKSLKIEPPYILVGHSLGGVYIRSFAGMYPGQVAGLVFIDPADFTETKNDWNDIFRALGVPEKKIEEMLIDRLYRQAKVDSANFGPSSERLMLTELRRNDFKEINALPFPKVPVYFLVGGKFEVPVANRSKDYDHEKFFQIKNNSNMERWKKLVYSTGKPGGLIYLTHAGHYIQRDEPQSVISTIRILADSLKE